MTARFASVVTMQAPVPEQLPDQPVKTEPAAAVAVSVTEVPNANACAQLVPHAIPAGMLVTVPAPEPLLATVTVRGSSKPTTSTGVRRLVVVPSPSWPRALSPQHLIRSVAEIAQLWMWPAATPIIPLPRPVTATGVSCSSIVPSPSWPVALYPQHSTPPALVKAHECASPVATAIAFVIPETSTGVVHAVGSQALPSPSWPSVLLPQHLTPPV